jgi:L-fucose isomerase-like protein
MQAISLATKMPATCLDWNNNYGEDKDKCILFHCGPVPKSLMVPDSGHVTDHKMFSKSYGAGSGWGSNEGRIAPGDMTFASAKTHHGSLVFYIDEGEFTRDVIEQDFFGCGGVAYIPELERKLNTIGRDGYRHHVSVGRGHVLRALREAFGTYLKYDIEDL